MPDSQQTYTYRAGQRIVLEKRPDQFVVRTLPDELMDLGFTDPAERVSSASSRVTTRATDLEPLMSRSRQLAPTHHAYYEAETGQEFLITDRLFVTFTEPLSDEQVDAFAGRYGLIRKATYGDRDYLFQLTDHTGMNPVKLVVTLTEQEPLVESADHDLNQRMSLTGLGCLPARGTAAKCHSACRMALRSCSASAARSTATHRRSCN